MKRGLMILVVVGLIAAAGAEIFLPQLAKWLIIQSLSDNEITAAEMQVQVESKPALRMLLGDFDQAQAVATNVLVGDAQFSRFECRMEQVKSDRRQLLSKGRMVVVQTGKVEVMAVVKQEDLERYLREHVDNVQEIEVSIEKGQMSLRGKYKVAGLPLAIALEGQVVDRGNVLFFVPSRVKIAGHGLANLGKWGEQGLRILDARKLPYGVTLRQVALEQGEIILRAENSGSYTAPAAQQ